MAIDAEALKASLDIVEVIGRRVELRKVGKDYRGLCPFHADSNPSLDVVPSKQMYHCKSCGASGDVIKFVMEIDNVDFPTAAASLGATPKTNGHARVPIAAAPVREPVPPPEGTEPPDFGRNAGVWLYKTESGRPWFYIVRYDTGEVKANGKKVKFFTPWTWTAADGWQKLAMPSPRPLYGLERLAAAPEDAAIVLVEGEKCSDAGAGLFPANRVVMTWPGGAQAVDKASFEPCRGRRVYLWPDPDAAGTKCREALLAILRDLATEVLTWDVSDCAPEFDLAEAVAQGWDFDRLQQWSGARMPSGARRLARHVYPAPVPVPAVADPRRVAAMNYTKADMAASGVNIDHKPYRHRFVLGGKDKNQVIKCMANCILPFRDDAAWQGVLRFDEMRQVIRCAKPAPWGEKVEQWTGSHDVRAAEWMDRIGLHYSPGTVAEAILRVAQENGYHPVREFLDTVEPTWDGTARADSWLIDYCGAPDTPFTRFIAAKFLIAAVSRAREPGCFVKNVLLLHGPQDAGKSWVPQILGGEWAGELLSLSDGMKATEQCSKLWIIENSDMAGTHKAGDELIKKFIATRVDTYRPAYARHVVDVKRCCVFIFTANPDETLTDSTGNVRYWPVEVSKVDRDGLRAVRDQLWAEAAARQAAGETYWMDEKVDAELRDQARAEQAKREVYDEWTTALRDWLEQPQQRTQEWFRLKDVMDKALGLGTDRQPLDIQRRAGSLMRKLGYQKSVRDGAKAWVRPQHVAEWVPEERGAGGMFED